VREVDERCRILKALLAEDDPLVRSMIVCSLREFGMDVLAVETGDAAWSLIKGGHVFDLLITDVRMPGQIDGIELAYLCETQIPDAHIIVMSAYTGKKYAGDTPTYNFLAKPFTLHQLASVIHKVSPTTLLVGP
jgi:CheY-like chemotaxis protein